MTMRVEGTIKFSLTMDGNVITARAECGKHTEELREVLLWNPLFKAFPDETYGKHYRKRATRLVVDKVVLALLAEAAKPPSEP